MFNSTVISVNTPDNHSIFIDLFRNETETILNTLLLAKLTEFLSYDKYDITQVILGMDIMCAFCILCLVILQLKYIVDLIQNLVSYKKYLIIENKKDVYTKLWTTPKKLGTIFGGAVFYVKIFKRNQRKSH